MLLQIQSVGFDKGFEKSGVKLNDIFFRASRGLNIYLVQGKKIVYKNYDTYQYDKTNDLVVELTHFLDGQDYEYIIGVADDDAVTQLDINQLVNGLPRLSLTKILDLQFRDSYYFLFNNLTKTLITERISRHTMIIDTYKLDPETKQLIQSKTIYLVCQKNIFQYFKEYTDSFKAQLHLVYLILDLPAAYDYDNNPNDLYIFCQSIDKQLMTKPFQKMLINTEQMTIQNQNQSMRWYLDQHVQMIDYSIENMQMMLCPSSLYIPYQYEENEINRLIYFQTEPKIYDIAFCGWMSPRRKLILDKLQTLGYTVCNVVGWGDDRDKMIASCRILLNIHYESNYNIYESMRCDRWMFSRMPIVSENSIWDNLLDVKKYNTVSFCPYTELVSTVQNFLNNPKPPDTMAVDQIKIERSELLHQIVNKFC